MYKIQFYDTAGQEAWRDIASLDPMTADEAVGQVNQIPRRCAFPIIVRAVPANANTP